MTVGLSTYRDLTVWQKSMDLVEAAYRLANELPAEERYGLVGQMKRAAVSIPANIAEGYGRTHRGDYLRHLSFAKGSLAELETHLMLSVRIGFVRRETTVEVWALAQEVGKMLAALVRSLEAE